MLGWLHAGPINKSNTTIFQAEKEGTVESLVPWTVVARLALGAPPDDNRSDDDENNHHDGNDAKK